VKSAVEAAVRSLVKNRRLLAALALISSVAGCTRFGLLPNGPGRTLARDGRHLAPGDLAAMGPLDVVAQGFRIPHAFPVVVYRPAHLDAPAPAVVFLPGRVAPEDQYESYARALASRGFVVAVRGWYDLFRTDAQLAHDATVLYDWLAGTHMVDPRRVGVAGHSMGAKDAIWAAVDDPRFRAVVAIDPDDNGSVSVVHGRVAQLRVPLLLVGAEVAWRGSRVCAPKEFNYQRFFEHAPAGTVELTLRDADHVQVMDEPDRFGYSICRVGTADSFLVRTLSRRATVSFFSEHLLGTERMSLAFGRGASVRVREGQPSAVMRATR
jgi:dienelactone hydrolase